MKTYIYLLLDPNTKAIRYVGKTKTLNKRYNGHLCEGRKFRRNTHRTAWIRSLLNKGLKPVMQLLDWEENDGADAEIYWIKHFKDAGCDLVNDTIGGEAPMLGKKHSEATRLKMSNSSARKGKPALNKGVPHSEETKNKMAISQSKYKHLGLQRKLTEDEKKKMSLSLKEHYKTHSGSQTGIPHSEEVKAKIAASVRLARQNKFWSSGKRKEV